MWEQHLKQKKKNLLATPFVSLPLYKSFFPWSVNTTPTIHGIPRNGKRVFVIFTDDVRKLLNRKDFKIPLAMSPSLLSDFRSFPPIAFSQ